jgi:uncharacterized protein YndB with AHSA1/START domain
MRRFEASTMIDRPAGEVWAYAADIARHAEWMSVSDARALRGDGSQPGSRGVERMGFGPFRWDVEFEVSVAEPGRRLRWRADNPRFEVEVGLELEPTGPTSVRARYDGSIRMRGRWRLIGPLVAMEGAGNVRRELDLLKRRVEGTSAATVATAS